MHPGPYRTFCCAATRRLLCLLCLLGLACSSASASTEAAFNKACTKAKALDVLSHEAYEQATRMQPNRPLELSGQVKGAYKSGDKSMVILVLPDESTLDIELPPNCDLQANSRVRCLVKQSGGYGHTRLTLSDYTWDQTPIEMLAAQAKAALGITPAQKAQAAQTTAAYAQRQQTARALSLPNRGGDSLLDYERWITHFNPRLSASEVHTIASSVLGYCQQYGLADDPSHPYLVLAVIAAESRFNPNARSYKGAVGLGQLMPSTAAGAGVNPYNPVENLAGAISIIRGNLDKYNWNWNLALAAYNAGKGAVKKYGGVPPYRETNNYLWRIYDYYCMMTGQVPQKRPR